MHYKVTIGIPVFRVENFIRRTMESALSQTYSDIEFLVVDDASDDQSLNILESIRQTHPRGEAMRILTHSSNLGVSESRNEIIDNARGDYLYFMDSDDVIVKDTITLLMHEIEVHHADVVFGSYERIELSGKRSLFQYPKMYFEDADSLAEFAYQRYAGFQASACNYLVKLSLIRKNNLRFYKSDFWEDMAFTLNLVTMVNHAVLLPDITYTYLCRENSLSNSWHQEKINKDKIVQYFEAVAQLKTNDYNLRVKPYYPNRCYIAMMSDIYIICNVLAKQAYIEPAFANRELRGFIKHPASFFEILSFRQRRLHNIVLYLLGKLPACITLLLIRLFSKYKGL